MGTRKGNKRPMRSADLQRGKAAPAVSTEGRILVWATAKGFYGGHRIRPGQPFSIADEREFCAKSMTKIDPAKAAGPKAGAIVEEPPDDNPIGAE